METFFIFTVEYENTVKYHILIIKISTVPEQKTGTCQTFRIQRGSLLRIPRYR
jgi:hypothetical protein